MKKLRLWQSECVDFALSRYNNGAKHFLALATPGAGKTLMASELARMLLKRKLIDLIICFSPSSIVANDFRETLETHTRGRFDGLIGAKGESLTYQSLQYLNHNFWRLFEQHRVFVIFDEIHHCSGSNFENANIWGEQIMLNIQNRATYSLALTGTPWRSDNAPIVLSSYLQLKNKISCDFIYGLSEGIRDSVCRVPQIIAADNDNIQMIESDGIKTFASFQALLANSSVPYQEVIENDAVIKYIVSSANKKLNRIRLLNPEAAGLVVASSVEHAKQIATLMQTTLKEDSILVTYKEHEPTTIISAFRKAKSKWIISVGMISEGTNIPRLQVCCHLTNIKTEMHFRQILGRILRVTRANNQEAILYMPAEAKLLEYAYRVNQDVPIEADVVNFEKIKPIKVDSPENGTVESLRFGKEIELRPKTEIQLNEIQNDFSAKENELSDDHYLAVSYDNMINIFGRFKQESIALGLSDLV